VSPAEGWLKEISAPWPQNPSEEGENIKSARKNNDIEKLMRKKLLIVL